MTEKGILDYTVAPMQILTNMISSHVKVRRGTKQYKELKTSIISKSYLSIKLFILFTKNSEEYIFLLVLKLLKPTID